MAGSTSIIDLRYLQTHVILIFTVPVVESYRTIQEPTFGNELANRFADSFQWVGAP
jgi:hypothetical protein